MDRTNGELNRAVLAYRENPTPENERRLIAAQEAHYEHFSREEIADFQRRTHE
jgi:hypothetical protein